MNLPATVYVALGSNLEDPITHLTKALSEINLLDKTTILKTSRFYQTKPIGPDQPDIINAVIELSTEFSPYQLLCELQQIETLHNRERTIRFGARTLDLDILLFNNISINDVDLTIPHPRMQVRNFVLIPLQEIAGNIALPPYGDIRTLIANNDPNDYVIPLDFETLGDDAQPNP